MHQAEKTLHFVRIVHLGFLLKLAFSFFRWTIVITRFYTTWRTSCMKFRSCTGFFSEVFSEISLFVLPPVKNSKRLFTRQRKTLHFVKNIARLQGVCTEILCFRYATKSLCTKHEKRYILSKFFALPQEIIHEILSKISPFLLEKNN